MHLRPYTKVNWNYATNLNVRPETIKLPDGNIRKELLDIELESIFLYDTQSIGNQSAKVELHQTKKLRNKSTDQRGKQLNGRKYLQIIYLIRG